MLMFLQYTPFDYILYVYNRLIQAFFHLFLSLTPYSSTRLDEYGM